jgi:hypothetical protein
MKGKGEHMKKVMNWLFTNYKGEKVSFGWLIVNVLFAITLIGFAIMGR